MRIPSLAACHTYLAAIYKPIKSCFSKTADFAASFFRQSDFRKVSQRDRRLELFREHPFLAKQGDPARGEIELVLDPKRAARIEQTLKERWKANGVAQANLNKRAQSGVLMEDQYFILLKDPVIFPNGADGLYSRLIHASMLQGTIGAAALPITPEGKIVLNLNYRHATRGWEFELPRGFARDGEAPLQTVIRELKEETGLVSEPPVLLGKVAPDTGILASVPHVYLCRTTHAEKAERGCEAIKKCVAFTPDEIAKGLIAGYLEHEGEKIPLRDGFLAYALLQAHLQGAIKLKPQQPK